MSSLEYALVGMLGMLFAAFFVCVAVLLIITIRQLKVGIESNTSMARNSAVALKTAIDANSISLKTLIPVLDNANHREVGQAVRLIADHTPALLEQFSALAKLLNVFNGAVLNKPADNRTAMVQGTPPPPGRLFSAVPLEEDSSSFNAYDEEDAYRRDQLAQARKQGVRVADEPEIAPRPEQMVNIGEATAQVPVPGAPVAEAMPGVLGLEAVPGGTL